MSRRLSLAIALLVLGSPIAFAQPLPPQPVRPSSETFAKAEELFARDDLQQAEKIYLRVLESAADDTRAASFDRLRAIYVRWARPDLAVTIGLRQLGEVRASKDARKLATLQYQVGASYARLAHHAEAEKLLAEALASPLLDPVDRLNATRLLAQTNEQLGRADVARRNWETLEEQTRAAVDQGRLSPADERTLEWTLADRDVSDGKGAAAVARLTKLLAKPEVRGNPEAQCETLYRRVLARGPKAADADTERDLTLALALEQKIGDSLMIGDLHAALAQVHQRRKEPDEAESHRKQAAEAYTLVLKNRSPDSASTSAMGFWKLQRLYQTASQFKKALQLATAQKDAWGVDHLLEARLKADFGGIAISTGQYAEAMPSLRDAVRLLDAQSPQNLKDLPLALIHLADAELSAGDPPAARARAERVVEIYKNNKLLGDPVLVEAYHLAGSAAAQSGQFTQAFDAYREGTDLCAKLGPVADPELSLLLLQSALTYQAQGEMAESLRVCEQARAVCERFAEPDSPSFAAFDAAQANLCLNQGRLKDAVVLSKRILERGEKLDHGPFVITALHCQALDQLNRRKLDEAEASWKQVLERQEASRQLVLIPRTWNYLGLCAETRGDLPEAEKRYREALERQKRSPQTFPATHFISLWRLANILDRQKRGPEARALLEEALALVEKTRLSTFGDARQRASFFAQFGPGIDQLVEWNLRDHDWRGAFSAMARGRSRTLMDQMMLCGVDPRQHLEGPRGKELARRESELERTVATLRMRALSLPPGENQVAMADKILSEFDVAQQEYADVRREIFSASPIYRSMADTSDPGKILATLQEKALGPKRILLAYYIGQQYSYLVVASGGAKSLAVFPLKVSSKLAKSMVPPQAPTLAAALENSRGLRGIRVQAIQPPVDAPTAPEPPAADPESLSSNTARALVDNYLNFITDPTVTTTRGLRVQSKEPTETLPVQRPQLLGDIFLPPGARKMIRDSGAELVIVIPDGPLHKLPLETLVLGTDKGPRYLLEELPPVVYAPSSGILAYLVDRPRTDKGPLSLLTVGNPDYPQAEPGAKVATTSRGNTSFVIGFRGQLPLLAGSMHESQVVSKYFPDRAVALSGPAATEKAVVTAMRGKQVIHIAAHGFADDRFGNLFGALALTPPAKVTSADDDGFLSLHEIYQLPLESCELAVLSACQTNVGPQQPLESGVTLANGFLAAGARRVVASHWSVDDLSTAQLMETFFQELTRTYDRDHTIAAAESLKAARMRVRNEPRWASPFYWGPFVVMGAPY
jgi:CHAT domain-containing protein/tetratricopeptide (TPR) repeat protein